MAQTIYDCQRNFHFSITAAIKPHIVPIVKAQAGLPESFNITTTRNNRLSRRQTIQILKRIFSAKTLEAISQIPFGRGERRESPNIWASWRSALPVYEMLCRDFRWTERDGIVVDPARVSFFSTRRRGSRLRSH